MMGARLALGRAGKTKRFGGPIDSLGLAQPRNHEVTGSPDVAQFMGLFRHGGRLGLV
ncbi:hypothetical protein SGLAU_29075 [Streptomyces glaucescens]|uniref:Uncharacterized protein n=1 Tax=Streptomyces glaucescens TaxID=1907 RepID=A0A089XEN8_STRGA|nr:hypothetical protein SGLAU_29075 [Streptomyces glaucescens]